MKGYKHISMPKQASMAMNRNGGKNQTSSYFPNKQNNVISFQEKYKESLSGAKKVQEAVL